MVCVRGCVCVLEVRYGALQGDVLAGALAAFLGWGNARFKREQQQQQQQQQQQEWVVAAAAAACHVVRSAACMASASVPSPRHVS